MVKTNYITKDYFDKSMQKFKTELREEIKGDLLEIKEEIMGELKDAREERDTHNYSHSRINDDIQEHEDRLKTLESAKN